MIGERTRLYQAALEERRRVFAQLDDLIAPAALEVLEHIEQEVERTRGELWEAYYSRR